MSRYADPSAERSRERHYENSYQSLSLAPIYVENEKWYQEKDYNLPTGTVPGTARPHLVQSETPFYEFIGDWGSLGGYLMNGSGWSRRASSSFPLRPSWTSPKLRENGPQSSVKIRNRDTISKDKTAGDGAQMDDLFTTIGRKVMGVKQQQEQQKDTSTECAWSSFPGPGCVQDDRVIYMISQTSKRPLGFGKTYVGNWYIETDDDKDKKVDLGEYIYALPKHKPTIYPNNNNIINMPAVKLEVPEYIASGCSYSKRARDRRRRKTSHKNENFIGWLLMEPQKDH